MTPCTLPKQPGDTRYVYGLACTWHGPIRQSHTRRHSSTDGLTGRTSNWEQPCCPHCAGPLAELPSETEFWHLVRLGEQAKPGYDALMHWAAGRCFPADGDLLEEAYRQAIEGQS